MTDVIGWCAMDEHWFSRLKNKNNEPMIDYPLTYHMSHTTVTLVTKFHKIVTIVTLISLCMHNLLLCCGGIETNPGPK